MEVNDYDSSLEITSHILLPTLQSFTYYWNYLLIILYLALIYSAQEINESNSHNPLCVTLFGFFYALCRKRRKLLFFNYYSSFWYRYLISLFFYWQGIFTWRILLTVISGLNADFRRVKKTKTKLFYIHPRHTWNAKLKEQGKF